MFNPMPDAIVAVVIAHHQEIDESILQALFCGVEEEGIPYLTVMRHELDYKQLAKVAADLSQLEVGIGVDKDHRLCVAHAKFPQDWVIFEQTIQPVVAVEQLRRIGANAARLIKGIAFKTV